MARIRGPQIGVLCLLVVATGFSILAVAPVGASTFAAKNTCSATASGAAWKYKGQHGTKYKIVAVNGSSSLCSTAAKWMNRLSHNRATFQLKRVPPGWRCAAIGDYSGLAKMGECQYKSAIIEWLPATK
jgi:ABC-type phosphate transport system substrate-binding protein